MPTEFPWHALEAARLAFTTGLKAHFDQPIGRIPALTFDAAFKAALLAYLSEYERTPPDVSDE